MIMDFIALWIVKLFLKRRRKIRYFILASAITTTISIMLFLTLNHYIIYQLIVHFILNPIMVIIAFGNISLKKIAVEYVFTYIGIMFMGGALDFFYLHIGNKKGYVFYLSIIVVLLLGVMLFCERILSVRQQIFEVELMHEDKKVALKGFYDSGNLLTDPYVNSPVHIVEQEYIMSLIEEFNLHVRYIPFHSLGKKNGLLPVVTLDYLYIKKEEGALCIEKPVCGISKEKLFQDRICQVLLNSQSMKI